MQYNGLAPVRLRTSWGSGGIPAGYGVGITFEEDKREMSQNAPGGAPPNRISSEEVFVSCAGHPSHVETGEGRGEEEKGREKGKGKGRFLC